MTRSKRRTLSVVMAIMMMFTLILPGVGTVRAQGLDKGNLQDGTYEIDVELWHATNAQSSMAAGVIQDVAEVVVENGVYTMTVYTQTATIMGATANLESMLVRDENDNQIQVVEGELNEDGYPTSISFVMPHTEEFISVSVVSMNGNMIQQARLKLDWGSLTQISGTEDAELIELEDGTYEINVALYHATNNQPSMAAGVLQDIAEIVAEDGVYTMHIYPQEAEIMGRPANLESMEVFDNSGNFVTVTRGELDENDNPTSFSFVMPHTEEFISVSVNNSQARLKLDWDSLTLVAEVEDDDAQASEDNEIEVEDDAQASEDNEIEVEDDTQASEDNEIEVEDDTQASEDNEIEVEDDTQASEDNEIEVEDDTQASEDNEIEVEDDEIDIDNLEDGTYEINVALWQATNDAASMAAGVLQNIAEIEVEDGVYTMTVYTQTATIMGMPANLEGMEVFDENNNAVEVRVGEVDANGNPRSLSFVMPHTEEYISVSVTSMNGAMTNQARLKLDWNSLTLVAAAEDNGTGSEDSGTGSGSNGAGSGNNGAGSGNNGIGSGNNGTGTGNADLDPNNLEDGTYEINVELWHATNNTESMARGVLQETAEIVVENGVYTMVLHTQVAEIMGMSASLEAMRVFGTNGREVAVSVDGVDVNGNPTRLAFGMPHVEEFIAVSVTSMNGAMVNDARLRLDWDSLVKVSEGIVDVPTGGAVGGNAGNNNNGNTGSNDSNVNNSILDRENLEDGIYEVEVALWHVTNDTESMANGALKNIARIVVEDGDYTMFTYTQPMTLGTITASLQSKQVENSSGGFSLATVETTDIEGNPSSFSFEMPHTENFINAKVNPMVAIMGNDYIDARINVNWSTLQQVSDTTDLGTAPEGATVGTSANASGEVSTFPGQIPTASGQSSPGSVQTGDDMNVLFYTMALLSSGLVIGYYIWKNKFRKAVRVDD